MAGHISNAYDKRWKLLLCSVVVVLSDVKTKYASQIWMNKQYSKHTFSMGVILLFSPCLGGYQIWWPFWRSIEWKFLQKSSLNPSRDNRMGRVTHPCFVPDSKSSPTEWGSGAVITTLYVPHIRNLIVLTYLSYTNDLITKGL